MKIITETECQAVLETLLGKYDLQNGIKANFAHCATYALPIDTGRKTALANVLAHFIEIGQSGLFWITDWGIWPSSQNMDLFDGYRKSLGETRNVYDAPGHIFSDADMKEVVCLLDLVLYFYWDAFIFDGVGSIVIETSHDECISIHAKNIASLTGFKTKLERLELKEWLDLNKTSEKGPYLGVIGP